MLSMFNIYDGIIRTNEASNSCSWIHFGFGKSRMKKTFTLFAIWFAVVAAFAQSAPTFPYQAVVRNSQNH